MGIGKDKRYFDREFKYEAIRLMNEGKKILFYRFCKTLQKGWRWRLLSYSDSIMRSPIPTN